MPRFNGSNYLVWKLKMCAILIKDGCVVTLKGKENKPERMKNKVFAKKGELTMANIYFALDEIVLFNVPEKITAKGL